MQKVRLIKPYIEYHEVEADFRKVFAEGIFTRGSNVNQFAQKLGQHIGSKHTFLTTSATTALWLSLKALGLTIGDEVAISDFSFPATANAVEDLGAKPVFVDVDMHTFNMDPNDLAKKLTSKTKAVIFVDAFGNPTGIHKIKKMCKALSIPLIEDAACALGSSEHDIPCGRIADITCFSFHPRKLLCTGEGGAITTDDDNWAGWLENKLLHGANKTSTGSLEFINYGFNFRMTELQAVMGLKQIDKIPYIVFERTRIRNAFSDQLEPLGFKAQKIGVEVRHNVQSLVFLVPRRTDRNQLVNYLATKGIESTIGTYSQSNQLYYKTKYNNIQPNSASLEANTITLPCYEAVPVEEVCKNIRHFLGQY